MREPDAATLQKFQNDILEAIATGTPLADVASLMCRKVEAIAPQAICTMIRVEDGRLRPLAAPSLPAYVSALLEGVPIGPSVGSCGTAAFLARPVEVSDIATDPLWKDHRNLGLPLGLAACWSTPILATDGRVVGTFAFYYREKRGPSEAERRLVEASVHLGAIAIERSEAEELQRRLAFYDPVTELPNRRSFEAAIAGLCAEAADFGLLIIGFDRLNTMKIDLDELSSERMTREAAARLGLLGRDFWVASLGGDHFAVLVRPCGNHHMLRETGRDILDVLRHQGGAWRGAVERGVSIGGALFGSDGTTPDMLRQNAELARAVAEAQSRHGYAEFHPSQRVAALRHRAVLRESAEALAEGRVMAYYQPIVRLDDRRIVGLEALLRMRSREGKIVAATDFREAFADPRVANDITARLVELVAADMAGWLAAGLEIGHVGINVATADFLDGDLAEELTAAFGARGVPLKHIVVEITEMIFMDDPSHDIAKSLQGLRDRGMLVALDDFGTGFASLTHLLSMPTDIIKIDRSFIKSLLTDRHSAVIVESLLDIARKLDKRVVCEGIETEAQAERLIALGCTLGQGYLYARPGDAELTTRRLAGGARIPVIA